MLPEIMMPPWLPCNSSKIGHMHPNHQNPSHTSTRQSDVPVVFPPSPLSSSPTCQPPQACPPPPSLPNDIFFRNSTPNAWLGYHGNTTWSIEIQRQRMKTQAQRKNMTPEPRGALWTTPLQMLITLKTITARQQRRQRATSTSRRPHNK